MNQQQSYPYYRSIRLTLIAFSLIIFHGHCLFGQWPPTPPRDLDWSGIQAGAQGPIPFGASVSAVAPNGDVYIAAKVGSSDIIIAHWDGSSWVVLGERLSGFIPFVRALAVDVNGNVYVGGTFEEAYNGAGQPPVATSNIARWDALTEQWGPLGQGVNDDVLSLAIDGDNVYVAGPLFGINPDGNQVSIYGIGCWNTNVAEWQSLGQGTGNTERPFRVAIGNNGQVYIFGYISNAIQGDGTALPVNGIACWDGSSWSALGQGLTSLSLALTDLAVDTGGNVFISGDAGLAAQKSDGTFANDFVLYWDGTDWQDSQHPTSTFAVLGLASDASGKVYGFYMDDASFQNRISAWNGQSWDAIGEPGGEGVIYTIAGNRNFAQERLFCGGFYQSMQTLPGNTAVSGSNNMLWHGPLVAWKGMTGNAGSDGNILTIDAEYTGPMMVGGNFNAIAGVPANNVALFDGNNWHPIGGGTNGFVHAIEMTAGGYHAIAGSFTEVMAASGNTTTVNNIAVARVNNNQLFEWLPLGGGVNGPVYAVLNTTLALSFGLVGEVVVGGNFSEAINPDGSVVPVNSVAIWNWITNSWQSDVGGVSGGAGEVRTLAWKPYPYQIAFYAGGSFTHAVNGDGSLVASPNIALGYVSQPIPWEAAGQGTDGPVYTIKGYDDITVGLPGETRVWVGGDFNTVTNGDGNTVNSPNIALFYGDEFQVWQGLGNGVNGPVYSLTPLTTTYYAGIFLGGDFSEGIQADGSVVPMNNVGVYSLAPDIPGTDHGWNARVNLGLNGPCRSLVSGRHCWGIGELVYAGGDFSVAGASSARGLAKWQYTWQPYYYVFNLSPYKPNGADFVSYFVSGSNYFGCSSLNESNSYVLADSLSFLSSVVIDSLPQFQETELNIYDVNNPFTPLATLDSISFDQTQAGGIILAGVGDTASYAPNPEGRSTALRVINSGFSLIDGQLGTATVIFVNAVTDAPTVNIRQQGGGAVVDSLGFGDTSEQLALSPGNYLFEITRSDDGTLLGTYTIDLQNAANETAFLVLSGFLDPAANQDGPAMAFETFPLEIPHVVGIDAAEDLPGAIAGFQLAQNYPNPFNPSTTIEFSLAKAAHATVEIFNIIGERVAVLAGQQFSAGIHQLQFDARALTSGVYFYRLQAGEFAQTRKMILLR